MPILLIKTPNFDVLNAKSVLWNFLKVKCHCWRLKRQRCVYEMSPGLFFCYSAKTWTRRRVLAVFAWATPSQKSASCLATTWSAAKTVSRSFYTGQDLPKNVHCAGRPLKIFSRYFNFAPGMLKSHTFGWTGIKVAKVARFC